MKININQNDSSYKDKDSQHGNVNRDFSVRNNGNNSNKNYGFGEPLSRGGNISRRDKGNSPFTLKNSLIITPHYEVEFELTGGIRYVKNHRNDVLAVGDRISVIMNDVKKIPILLKREIDKRSEDKKIVVAETYNFDDVYFFRHDVSLFYDENKIDSLLRCEKNDGQKPVGHEKNVISSMSIGYSFPEIRDIIRLDSGGNATALPVGGKISDSPCDSAKFDLGGSPSHGSSSVSVIFDQTAAVSYGGKFFSMAFRDDEPLKFSFVFA